MHIYLIRHAIAYERDPMRWPNDANRPLTVSGEEKFTAAARGLRRVVGSVDVLLSSGFTRAWQTARILKDTGKFPEPIRCAALEVGHNPEEVVAVLQGYAGVARIALVGHEPNLTELAAYLLVGPGGDFSIEMKKGGVGCLSFNGLPEPGQAMLQWWLKPKFLRMPSQ